MLLGSGMSAILRAGETEKCREEWHEAHVGIAAPVPAIVQTARGLASGQLENLVGQELLSTFKSTRCRHDEKQAASPILSDETRQAFRVAAGEATRRVRAALANGLLV